MKWLESLVMGVVLAGFALVLIASVVVTFAMTEDDKPATGVGILAAGCIIGLAIFLHGTMTRRPPQD